MDPSADLSDSSVFATHAMVVMSAFEDIFENLDDPDIVKDILNQGRSHSKFSEDFAPETFWVSWNSKRFFVSSGEGRVWSRDARPNLSDSK